MDLGGYVFTLGAAFIALVLTAIGTTIIIRLDEPKRDKKTPTDA